MHQHTTERSIIDKNWLSLLYMLLVHVFQGNYDHICVSKDSLT